jgi:hypothetical protein
VLHGARPALFSRGLGVGWFGEVRLRYGRCRTRRFVWAGVGPVSARKRRRCLFGRETLATLALSSLGGVAHAAGVNLRWVGSADALGYRVYSGAASRQYTQRQNADSPAANASPYGVVQFALTGLVSGETYYVAVTAYNSAGESPYSNEKELVAGADSVTPPAPDSPTPPQATETAAVNPTSTVTGTVTNARRATATGTPLVAATRTLALSESAGGQESCGDHIDNDDNGLTDCADPACARASPCVVGAPSTSPLGTLLAVAILVFIGWSCPGSVDT